MSIINPKKKNVFNMITNCIKVPGMICMIDLLNISLEKINFTFSDASSME